MANKRRSQRKTGKRGTHAERQRRRAANELPVGKTAKMLDEARDAKANVDAINVGIEELTAEFKQRYDQAEAMATAADQDPTPDRYFALLGYYEEFAKWLDANPAVKHQSNNILGIKKLNDTLFKRVEDRMKELEAAHVFDQEPYTPEQEEARKEWEGWRRLWLYLQKDDKDINNRLAAEGLRLRHGHNAQGEQTVWTEPIREELEEPPPLPTRPPRHSRWEEVVDLQDEMIRFWYTPFGREYGRMWGEHMVKSADMDYVHEQQAPGTEPWRREDNQWAQNMDAINRACLQMANPIYVSPEVQDTIEYAAQHETFAMEGLAREDVFPNMHGFCVFPRPFEIMDRFDKKLAFRAVAWMPIGPKGEIAYDIDFRVPPQQAIGVLLIAYSHHDDPDDYQDVAELDRLKGRTNDLPVMSLCYVTPWTFDNVKKPIDMTGSNLAQFCAIVQTMWRFAKQTVIVPERTKLPRPERRRAERSGLISDVVVIKLRRKKYASSTGDNGGGERKVGVGFRYWVGLGEGGFWRNQWYPKEQVHKQIWIEPFLKGEEGAEIRFRPLHAYEITE